MGIAIAFQRAFEALGEWQRKRRVKCLPTSTPVRPQQAEAAMPNIRMFPPAPVINTNGQLSEAFMSCGTRRLGATCLAQAPVLLGGIQHHHFTLSKMGVGGGHCHRPVQHLALQGLVVDLCHH